LAGLLGLRADRLSAGRVIYDLRRLRLHGLIERVPRSHRYRLTQRGIQIAAFWTRTYNRLLRPGLAQLADPDCESPPLRRKFDALAKAIDQAVAQAKIAA
jgi:DNA-binding IclR family transcriptional regulator